jgi:hypothetical protein
MGFDFCLAVYLYSSQTYFLSATIIFTAPRNCKHNYNNSLNGCQEIITLSWWSINTVFIVINWRPRCVFCFSHFGDIELFIPPPQGWGLNKKDLIANFSDVIFAIMAEIVGYMVTPVVGVIFPDYLLKGAANAYIKDMLVDSRYFVLAELGVLILVFWRQAKMAGSVT